MGVIESQSSSPAAHERAVLQLPPSDPTRFQRRGGRKRIVAPDGSGIVPSFKPQPGGTLVKALARAWRWQRMLDEGVYTSVSEIGDAENISKSYVSRVLRLALLVADIVQAILAGKTDQALMLQQLQRPLPASWEEQRPRTQRTHLLRNERHWRLACMPVPRAGAARIGKRLRAAAAGSKRKRAGRARE